MQTKAPAGMARLVNSPGSCSVDPANGPDSMGTCDGAKKRPSRRVRSEGRSAGACSILLLVANKVDNDGSGQRGTGATYMLLTIIGFIFRVVHPFPFQV